MASNANANLAYLNNLNPHDNTRTPTDKTNRAELQLASIAAFQQKEAEVAKLAAAERQAARGLLENSKADALRAQYVAFDDNWSKELAESKEAIIQTFTRQRDELFATQQESSGAIVGKMAAVQADAEQKVADATIAIREELGRERAAAACREGIQAVWQLEEHLASGQPLSTCLARLRAVAREDHLLSSVVETIPERVSSKEDIKLRFRIVEEEVSRATYAPSNTSVPILLRAAVGEVLSRLLYRPGKPAPRFLPPGETENDLLARVSFFLEEEDMASALQETRRLRGMSRALIKDWETALCDHVVAEQGAEVLKAKFTKDNARFLE
jgi:hypothetical protein